MRGKREAEWNGFPEISDAKFLLSDILFYFIFSLPQLFAVRHP